MSNKIKGNWKKPKTKQELLQEALQEFENQNGIKEIILIGIKGGSQRIILK
jgi:hypothetical protein